MNQSTFSGVLHARNAPQVDILEGGGAPVAVLSWPDPRGLSILSVHLTLGDLASLLALGASALQDWELENDPRKNEYGRLEDGNAKAA